MQINELLNGTKQKYLVAERASFLAGQPATKYRTTGHITARGYELLKVDLLGPKEEKADSSKRPAVQRGMSKDRRRERPYVPPRIRWFQSGALLLSSARGHPFEGTQVFIKTDAVSEESFCSRWRIAVPNTCRLL